MPGICAGEHISIIAMAMCVNFEEDMPEFVPA
jgi:hypothetical protein